MAGTVTPVEPIKALPKRNESNLIKTAEASYVRNFESDKETGKISGSGLVGGSMAISLPVIFKRVF